MPRTNKKGKLYASSHRKSRNKKWERRRPISNAVTTNDCLRSSLDVTDVLLNDSLELIRCPLQGVQAASIVQVSISKTTATEVVNDENVLGCYVTVSETIDNDILPINLNDILDSEVVVSASSDDGNVAHCINGECASPAANVTSETDGTTVSAINGRQIVDMGFVFDEVHRTFDDHAEKTNCRFKDWKLIKSRRRGFLNQLFFRCQNCNHAENIWSEPLLKSALNVNKAAVLGTVTTGIGFSQLQELSASMQVECMSEKTYIGYREETTSIFERSAALQMEEAAEVEKKLAIESGDILDDGTACIGVVTDGSWAKRSYGTNYNSLSGFGLIVGLRTGKPLYVGIRNKFCTSCDIAQRRGTAPKPHKCWKNFSRNESSTKMESDAIVEGFDRSVEMYGLVYNKVVADGDSNLIKAIRDRNPYHKYGVQVRKVECTNHLLRNLCKKIKDASKVTQPKGRRKCGFVAAKDAIKSKILVIRSDVVRATKRWSEIQGAEGVRAQGLQRDILNICSHVFGDHKRCGDRECKEDEKASKENIVPALKAHGLYQRMFEALQYISCFADSLLVQETNNPAESCNAVVCKTIGGKRIHFGSRDSYNARVLAALMQCNSQHVLSDFYKNAGMDVPDIVQKLEAKRKLKRENTTKARKMEGRIRRLHRTEGLDKYYGPNAQKPDKDPETLALLRKIHEEELAEKAAVWERIEDDTKEQSDSELWQTLRRRMLTASNFGAVCRMRNTTSCARQVRAILFPSIPDVPALKYGRDQEGIAKQQLAVELKQKIQHAGLFIDQELHFLGASPDGLIDEDGLVEIKCPLTAKDLTTPEAATEFKNMNGVFDKKNEQKMNPSHRYFYQVQGQLHITRRDYCIFAAWSPNYMKYIRVERNDAFWKGCMENKLKDFYLECMLPEILDSRHLRNMPIRNPERIVDAQSKAKLVKMEKESKKMQAPRIDELQHKLRKRRASEISIEHEKEDDELICLGVVSKDGFTDEQMAERRDYFDNTKHCLKDIEDNVLPVKNELNGDSLDTFLRIVREKYGYATESVSYMYEIAAMIHPVESGDSVQIFGGRDTNHWKCLHSDGSKIRVYDSMGGRRLTKMEQEYIRLRYPTVQLCDVSFRKVQHQPPGVSCGVYAAAFATSIVLGNDPSKETYSNNEKVMREHFMRIVRSGSLHFFPRE